MDGSRDSMMNFEGPELPSAIYEASLAWPHRTWSTYVRGFKQAGDLLVNQLPTAAPDTLVLPIGFLYRHYVELQLKCIMAHALHLLDEAPRVPEGHNLVHLWRDARTVCERTNLGTAEWFDRIDTFVGDFITLDPVGQAFRYPVDRQGARTIPSLPTLNVPELAATANRGADLLDGLLAVIDDARDGKHDMRRGSQ